MMALYLLPDASFCIFFRISSILTYAGARPPTARGEREARPGMSPPLPPGSEKAGRPLRLPASGPGAAADESRPLHAAGHVSAVAPPRPRSAPPAGVRCATGMGPEAVGRVPDPAVKAGPWRIEASRKGGGGCPELARRPGVGRAQPEGASDRLREVGREGPHRCPPAPPAPAPGWRSWGAVALRGPPAAPAHPLFRAFTI